MRCSVYVLTLLRQFCALHGESKYYQELFQSEQKGMTRMLLERLQQMLLKLQLANYLQFSRRLVQTPQKQKQKRQQLS